MRSKWFGALVRALLGWGSLERERDRLQMARDLDHRVSRGLNGSERTHLRCFFGFHDDETEWVDRWAELCKCRRCHRRVYRERFF